MNALRFLIIAALLSGSWGCASQRQAVRPPSEAAPREARKTVYFDFNKTQVRSQDHLTLEEVAGWLKSDKKAMTILEGHTDQIGDDRYNDILSEDRARAVRVYLRDEGADPRRMTVISKGKREPVVRGHGRKALQPNRRVEVYLNFSNE